MDPRSAGAVQRCDGSAVADGARVEWPPDSQLCIALYPEGVTDVIVKHRKQAAISRELAVGRRCQCQFLEGIKACQHIITRDLLPIVRFLPKDGEFERLKCL